MNKNGDFDGKIEIILEYRDNSTLINKIYHDGVSMVSPTIHLDREKIPCYFLLHLGGGYVEGEETSMSIELKNSARAIISTQTPTVIYKCDNEIPSKQWNTITLGKNSVLEYVVDNTILFKNAIYEQNMDIFMDSSATFIYSDGITAGWSEDGKKHQYKQVKIKNKIFMDDNLILVDKMLLSPKDTNVNQLGVLENYTHYSTVIVIDSRINEEFIIKLREHLSQYTLDVNYGLSLLEVNGVVVRILGNHTQDIEKILFGSINYVRRLFFGSVALDLRKP